MIQNDDFYDKSLGFVNYDEIVRQIVAENFWVVGT